MQKHANLVDLAKSFPTNIYLQNLASIQPRTSLLKFEEGGFSAPVIFSRGSFFKALGFSRLSRRMRRKPAKLRRLAAIQSIQHAEENFEREQVAELEKQARAALCKISPSQGGVSHNGKESQDVTSPV